MKASDIKKMEARRQRFFQRIFKLNNMDYRAIFPTEKSQYDQLWNTDPAFRALSMKVYRYLDRLPPGRQLSYRTYTGDKLKYIIYTCWAYYWEPPHPYQWTFAPDFSAFRHHTDTRPDKNR